MNLGEKNSYTLNLINLMKNFCKFLRLGQQKKYNISVVVNLQEKKLMN